jgi:O-antigen ligase
VRALTAPLVPPLTGSARSAAVLLGIALVLCVAVGTLPLAAAGILAVGIPAVVLAAVSPRVTLALVILSIPMQSWTKVSFGPYDVTSTDVLVAFLIGGWVVRSAIGHHMELRGGWTIGAACALLGAGIISSVTATSIASSVKEIVKIAELVTVALYAATTMRRASDITFVVWALLGAGVIESGVGIFQFVTGRGPESFAIGPFIRAYGDFAQPNAFAGYLAMILPFGVMWSLSPVRYRPIAVLATGVLGIALLASLSRGAWLGSMIGLAVMALVWSARARRAFPFGASLLLLLFPAARLGLLPRSIAERISVIFENYWIFDAEKAELDSANWSIVERMANWQAAWKMAMDHPINGIGLGNYEAVYYPQNYYVGKWTESLPHAHNLYLNMFAEAGIIGLIAFTVFTIMPFLTLGRALRMEPRAALPPAERLVRRAFLIAVLGAAATFSVHNTFDNMFIHGMGVQFGLLLGLAEAQLSLFTSSAAEPAPAAPARVVYANWD